MRHPVIEADCRDLAAARLPFAKLKGKTILVTGAAGFVPAGLVEFFLSMNEARGLKLRVIGTCRDLAKAKRRFSHYAGRPDLKLLRADAGRALTVPGPVDHIFHAASQASPKFYGPDPVGTLAPNVLGTAHLLELARAKKSSLLFFSSSEVYGAVHKERLKEEDAGLVDPLDVRACYSESKRMGETLCAAWHRQHGVPAYIVRLFHTYGPGMALDDGRVFADFVSDLVAGRDIVVRGDGKAIRAYCYASDAAAGILTVLLKGEPAVAYNVGNDEAEASVWELAVRLAKIFPEKKLKASRVPRPAGSGYKASPFHRLCPDVSRLRALGWAPRRGLEEGFARTVRYYS